MEGGWPVLNVWLAEAKRTQDMAVLVEILQVRGAQNSTAYVSEAVGHRLCNVKYNGACMSYQV